jgi:phage gp45-like
MRHLSPRNTADRHGNALGRTVVEEVDDSKVMQESTHSLFTDEKQGQVEHVHPYGFTKVPKKPTGQGKLRRAAEAFMSFMGAGRSHGIAVVVGDRRFRLHQLAEGEVAMYDDQGQQVHFKRDGIWASVPNGKKIMLQVMDDDQMPQDQNAQGGGANQAQKMGQIAQAGRQAQINLTIDKTQFTLNHPDGIVNFNCKKFNFTATDDSTLAVGGSHVLIGTGDVNVKSQTVNIGGGSEVNVKSGANKVEPDWGAGASKPR